MGCLQISNTTVKCFSKRFIAKNETLLASYCPVHLAWQVDVAEQLRAGVWEEGGQVPLRAGRVLISLLPGTLQMVENFRGGVEKECYLSA